MWQQHVSPEGYPYYINAHTGVSQWERPEGWVGDVGSSAGPAGSSLPSGASPSALAAPLPSGSKWVLAADAAGNPFYYDEHVGCWGCPARMLGVGWVGGVGAVVSPGNPVVGVFAGEEPLPGWRCSSPHPFPVPSRVRVRASAGVVHGS
jgi:hypothetical protein